MPVQGANRDVQLSGYVFLPGASIQDSFRQRVSHRVCKRRRGLHLLDDGSGILLELRHQLGSALWKSQVEHLTVQQQRVLLSSESYPPAEEALKWRWVVRSSPPEPRLLYRDRVTGELAPPGDPVSQMCEDHLLPAGIRYFDDSLRSGSGIRSHFLLILGKDADSASKEVATQISESLGDIVELRFHNTGHITLVRPDGYVAFSASSRDGIAALESARSLLERQTTLNPQSLSPQ